MGHHSPKLNAGAYIFMGSVLVIYGLIKSPLKYKWASENRVSPKADLAWRTNSQKWLDNQ
ncbi:hypothetical protein CAAN1_17S03026 [[Candida] anglica]|uniref:Uncharacterized protein n=1 Tax=[Candida] anglica TaxID=148631 RepID=A0ABP0E7A0_9ASCO